MEGVPATDRLTSGEKHLSPMLAAIVETDRSSDAHHTDDVVAKDAIIVHHNSNQLDLIEVKIGEVKGEWLVVDRNIGVFLYTGFPLAHSLALVHQVDFHVWV